MFSLSIQLPRWLLALLGAGIVLVLIDLARTRPSAPSPDQPRAEVAATNGLATGQAESLRRPAIATMRDDTRRAAPPAIDRVVQLACGCRIDALRADQSPAGVIRFGDGGMLLFDNRFRAVSYHGPPNQRLFVQLSYDEQDRVQWARHDPLHTKYLLDRQGNLVQVQQTPGPTVWNYPHVPPSKAARTPRPADLPHPHVPAGTPMHDVLGGTWRAIDETRGLRVLPVGDGAAVSRAAAGFGRLDEGYLSCGCYARFNDGGTPSCSFRFADGSHLFFDHRMRADTLSRGHATAQFRYDEQDRVVSSSRDSKYDLFEYPASGPVKITVSGGTRTIAATIAPPPGARTPRPDLLPHPHVPQASAIGRVLAQWPPARSH